MFEIKVPELGEGIESATIACWHVKEGDPVQSEDDVVELVTDKASFNVPVEVSGVVTDILVAEGEEAAIGQTIALVDSES